MTTTTTTTLVLTPDASPLRVDDYGAVRVSGTRVTLDSIVYCYLQGEPIEYIHEAFPTVPLADVHATIAYYLRNRQVVDQYLEERRRAGDELRRRIESDPEQQKFRATLRERARAQGLR
jgi:uncharacterized protein (DUF433 family)